MNKNLLLETVLVSCGGPYSEELAYAVCYGKGELPGGCSGNGGMSLGCSAGAGGCSADIPVVGLDTVTFTCGLPTYDPPTPDFDQSFYDEWEGDYGHHPGHGVTPDKSIPSKTSITNLTKKIIQEQIGGEIKSPNEFLYFDFKDWVYSDRKYYFREKTFKNNNNMTLAQAVEENLLEDLFQMLTTLWETFVEETEVPMHGKIEDKNRLKFGEDLYEMMKENNLLFKKDKAINSSLNLDWPRSFQLQEQTPDYITYPGGGGDFDPLEQDACLDENGIYNCGITLNGNQTHCFICSGTIPVGLTGTYWSGISWQPNIDDVLCSQMTTNPYWNPDISPQLTPPVWSQSAVNHPSQCNTTWSPSCELLDGQPDDQIQFVVDYCNDIPEAMWGTDQFAAMLCPCLTPQDIYNPQFQQADCNTFDTLPLDFQNTICQSCEDPNYVNMHCQCCDDPFTVGGSAVGGGDAFSMPSTPSLTKTPINKKVVNRLQKLAGVKTKMLQEQSEPICSNVVTISCNHIGNIVGYYGGTIGSLLNSIPTGTNWSLSDLPWYEEQPFNPGYGYNAGMGGVASCAVIDGQMPTQEDIGTIIQNEVGVYRLIIGVNLESYSEPGFELSVEFTSAGITEEDLLNSCPNQYPCASLEQHAISLGMQPGTPGIDGTIMSAADQFCVKCQAQFEDPKCSCCDTDYMYDDDTNVLTYEPDRVTLPLEPSKDPQKDRMKKLAGLKNKK